MATCKLCLLDKQLISNSHIISKFIFKHTLLTNSNKFFEHKTLGKSRPLQDGAYEGDHLCAECEGRIQKYETVAKRFLFGLYDEAYAPEIVETEGILSLTGVNYKRVKPFVLSLLWRASISRMFDMVNLEPSQSERLREILLNDEEIEESEFPVFIWNYANHHTVYTEMILAPFITGELNGRQDYVFPCAGMMFQVCLKHPGLNEIEKKFVLNKSGNLIIAPLRPEFSEKFFGQYLEGMG